MLIRPDFLCRLRGTVQDCQKYLPLVATLKTVPLSLHNVRGTHAGMALLMRSEPCTVSQSLPGACVWGVSPGGWFVLLPHNGEIPTRE